MINKDTKAVGVVVGRFQVPQLTDGHKEILDYCLSKGHEKNILFLGVPPTDVRCTKKNPIPFAARRQMIEEEYPGKFIICYIKDVTTDEQWSRNLDAAILDMTEGEHDVILYGSRDSFINHYRGKFKTEEYHQRVLVSGTMIRESAAKTGDTSYGFRLGCVYATQKSWTNFYPTVDCAIATNWVMDKFIMAKKSGETKLRFVGGFWDSKDNSIEDAAIREANEETGLKCKIHSYIGSTRIDDPRYRNEHEKIMTSFFLLIRENGMANASDDIAEVHTVNIAEVDENDVIIEHRQLLSMLKNHLRSIKKDHSEQDNLAQTVALNQGNYTTRI